MESYIEAFFGGRLSLGQESVFQAYAEALTASLHAEFRSLRIDRTRWQLEILGPRGHACPVLGFESRHACLVPLGSNVWNAHELYCAVDWTCSHWCGLEGETDTDSDCADFAAQLAQSRDPASRCGFRAFIAVLQGGFGLPRVQRAEPAAAHP